MNRKQLVGSVSEKFDLKPRESKEMVDYILTQLLEAGLSGEGFNSPILRVTSRDVEARVINTPEGDKAIPARKVMRIDKSKQYTSV